MHWSVLHNPPTQGGNIPPAELMARRYYPLPTRAKDMMLEDWVSNAPTPPLQQSPSQT